jgi:glycerophosphoryl diester phosphodiesterase
MSQAFAFTQRPIAHRGLHDVERGIIENSMSAFQAAVDGGYGIECDLQVSADGRAMVFHDPGLDRLTDSESMAADLTAEELGALTLKGGADTIRPLEDHLALVAGRIPLVLELKSEPSGSARLVEAVAKALESYDGLAVVMSFDHDHCSRFKAAIPDRLRGLTAMGSEESAQTHRSAMERYDLQFLSYDIEAIPTPFVAETRKRGLPIITWTVRTEDEVARSAEFADQMTFEGFRP